MNEKLSNQINRVSDSEIRSILKEISNQIPAVNSTIKNFYQDKSNLSVPTCYQMEKELKSLSDLLYDSIINEIINFTDYLKKLNLIYFKIQPWIDIFLERKSIRDLLVLDKILIALENEWTKKDTPEFLDLSAIENLSTFLEFQLARYVRLTDYEERIEILVWLLKNFHQNSLSEDEPFPTTALGFLSLFSYSAEDDSVIYGQDILKAYELFFFDPANKLVLHSPKYRNVIVDYIRLAQKLDNRTEYLNKLYNHFSFLTEIENVTDSGSIRDLDLKIELSPDEVTKLLNLIQDEESLYEFLQYLEDQFPEYNDFTFSLNEERLSKNTTVHSASVTGRKQAKSRKSRKKQKKSQRKQKKRKK